MSPLHLDNSINDHYLLNQPSKDHNILFNKFLLWKTIIAIIVKISLITKELMASLFRTIHKPDSKDSLLSTLHFHNFNSNKHLNNRKFHNNTSSNIQNKQEQSIQKMTKLQI